MNEYKILFTGTMGAGKTTAIGAVSETPPIVTDVVNNDQSHTKERTSVGLDFGQFTLDSGDRIRLFGTPGQSRFDFLWKILSKNALGMITGTLTLMLSGSASSPSSAARFWVAAIVRGSISKVVAVSAAAQAALAREVGAGWASGRPHAEPKDRLETLELGAFAVQLESAGRGNLLAVL